MIDPPDTIEYVTSMEEVLWGATLVAVTLVMHGFGMLGVLRANRTVKRWLGVRTSVFTGLAPLILASWMILLVHLLEVLMWALFFYAQGAFTNRSVSFYFALNEFTTLGSNYNLPQRWRLLEGMIATAGLLTFAWSTGFLMTLAQEFQDRHAGRSPRPHKPDPSGIAPAVSGTPSSGRRD